MQSNEFRLEGHIISCSGVIGRAYPTHKLSVNILCAIVSLFHFFHERLHCFTGGGGEKKNSLTKLLTAPVFGIQHRGCEGLLSDTPMPCGKTSDQDVRFPWSKRRPCKSLSCERSISNKWLGCIPHSEYWQSRFRLGTSPSGCVESLLCTQTCFFQQQCYNVRLFHIF